MLDDTLIVVSSDHGMPFPRVKGQIYEHGFHIPLAIRWGRQIKPGRIVTDFINVRDFAPTYLELAGLPTPASMSGRASWTCSGASSQARSTRRATGW